MGNRMKMLEDEYKACPYLVLSFPRCGRTWMRLVLGHYMSKTFNVEFTRRLERKRPKIPAILFRHDFMSTAGHIKWRRYFEIQDYKQLYFTDLMEDQKIIYLFRNPLDILHSYFPYLQTRPYGKMDLPQHKDIVEFASNKQFGLDVIINFLNKMIDHHQQNKNPKLVIHYERLKKNNNAWQKLIGFIFGDVNETNLEYAKKQTEFKTLQAIEHEKGISPEHNFFRKGRSNYTNELDLQQQNTLRSWPGLSDLCKRMESL